MKIVCYGSSLWLLTSLLHTMVSIAATLPSQPPDEDSPQLKSLRGLRYLRDLQSSTCSPSSCLPTATNCVAKCSGTPSKCAYSVPCTPEINKCKGCFCKQCKSVDCTPDGTNAFCTASCAKGTYGPSCVRKACTKDTKTGYCTTCAKGKNGNPNECVQSDYCVPGADVKNSCVAKCNSYGQCVYTVNCVGGTCKNGICTIAPSSQPSEHPSVAPTQLPSQTPSQAVVSSPGILIAGSIDGLFVRITYNWSLSQDNLDSGVSFLNSSQGADCLSANSDYLNFGGNVIGFGGSETITVNLGQSFADGQWKRDTLIRLRAGWASSDQGVANVTISTMQALGNGTTVNSTSSISLVIDPTGHIPGQCAAEVATISVVRNPSGIVTIQVAQP
jgi:hypothetical protein